MASFNFLLRMRTPTNKEGLTGGELKTTNRKMDNQACKYIVGRGVGRRGVFFLTLVAKRQNLPCPFIQSFTAGPACDVTSTVAGFWMLRIRMLCSRVILKWVCLCAEMKAKIHFVILAEALSDERKNNGK